MIIFDIETSALPDDQLAIVRPEFKPDGRLKDPAKIADDIAAKEADWKEKAALSAITGRVLAIGLLAQTDTYAPRFTVLQEETSAGNIGEAGLLAAFWDTWRKGCLFVGFCVKNFDLPFLAQRSVINRVPVPSDLLDGRWWSSRIIDLQERWLCYTRDSKGADLDSICKACGIGAKTGNGKDFAKLWATDRPKAIAYLRNDVEITAKLAERLGVK